jgi:hypothetical protein
MSKMMAVGQMFIMDFVFMVPMHWLMEWMGLIT